MTTTMLFNQHGDITDDNRGTAHGEKTLVRIYKGSQAKAGAAFQRDAAKLADQGYSPTSQSWAPGSYSTGQFLLAILLCIVIIGFVIFVYMLLVKPDGTLSVTYELRTPVVALKGSIPSEEKTCPMCAEQVKATARICRFCGHNFA